MNTPDDSAPIEPSSVEHPDWQGFDTIQDEPTIVDNVEPESLPPEFTQDD